MIAAPFAVVLDANVLYPFSLRDCLLRAAEEGLYQVLWSEQILEEVRRNLVANGVMPDTSAQRLIQVMNEAFPEALTSVSDGLIARMRNHPKDRHVVAAAVSAGAQLIVTSNLRDFKVLPAGIEALSPDDFLRDLFDLDPPLLVSIVRSQAAALRRPPRTFEEFVAGLSKSVPEFAKAIGQHASNLT